MSIPRARATAATNIPGTAPIPFSFPGFVSGSLSFTSVPGDQAFHLHEFSSRLGGTELAVSGVESFDVDILSGATSAFGFDFVEPQSDPNVNATFVERRRRKLRLHEAERFGAVRRGRRRAGRDVRPGGDPREAPASLLLLLSAGTAGLVAIRRPR